MSGYKTHSSFNLFLALPALVAADYYFLHTPYSLLLTFISSFAYTTLFMSPDLDLVHNIKITSLRGLLSLPFRFYSKVFSHRGISHSFFFGSLTRIVWLFCLATLIFFLLNKTLPTAYSLKKFYRIYEDYLLYGLAGICLADWCHLLLDIKIKS